MVKNPGVKRNVAKDAYTFLTKELEKVDEKILEPLAGTDWPRDLPVITGGGLLESVSSIDVTYASTGGEEDNLFFDAANDIPVIQADMSKAVARCFNFAEYMVFGLMEQEKMMQVGRDPETFLNKGIRLHCDKYLDKNAYVGFKKVNSTGLCNSTQAIRSGAATGASGYTYWARKTADEILADINDIISAVWTDNDCASDALPDHILVPVNQYGLLVTRKVSEDSEKSILSYVEENNLAAKQGRPLVISPCKWCSTIGQDSKDRLVCYSNQVDRVCFNLTQPLRRMDTEYAEMRIKIPYIAQFSEPRLLYPSTIRYLDGI
jgi:hypothetical protein